MIKRQCPVPDSILNKALKFLGRPPRPSAIPWETPDEEELNPTTYYDQLEYREDAKHSLTVQDEQLTPTSYYAQLEEVPTNLVVDDHDAERVIVWLRTRDHVAVDIRDPRAQQA